MAIHFDPRAIERKQRDAAELAKRQLIQPAKRLHPTDFAVIVAVVSLLAAVAALAMGA